MMFFMFLVLNFLINSIQPRFLQSDGVDEDTTIFFKHTNNKGNVAKSITNKNN